MTAPVISSICLGEKPARPSSVIREATSLAEAARERYFIEKVLQNWYLQLSAAAKAKCADPSFTFAAAQDGVYQLVVMAYGGQGAGMFRVRSRLRPPPRLPGAQGQRLEHPAAVAWHPCRVMNHTAMVIVDRRRMCHGKRAKRVLSQQARGLAMQRLRRERAGEPGDERSTQ